MFLWSLHAISFKYNQNVDLKGKCMVLKQISIFERNFRLSSLCITEMLDRASLNFKESDLVLKGECYVERVQLNHGSLICDDARSGVRDTVRGQSIISIYRSNATCRHNSNTKSAFIWAQVSAQSNLYPQTANLADF